MQEEKSSDLIQAVHDDPLIRKAVEVADRMGFPLYLVGGWIRDRFIGESSQDYDFIVHGDVVPFSEELSRSVEGTCFVMGHGKPPNCRVLGETFTMDLVPLYSAGLPDELRRRDFTINTIAYSFSENRLLDLFDGFKDIEDQVVRIVSPEVLDQDPIRMLRAVRFTTTLAGFRLSEETISEIRKRSQRLFESAVERIREETDRIMVSGRAFQGLSLMHDLDLLQTLFPEFRSLSGLEQGPYHHLDAFAHTLQVVHELDDLGSLVEEFKFEFQVDLEDRIALLYAALLHDIGKAECLTLDQDGIPHFYGHEKIGAEMAKKVLKKYCFPNKQTERIVRLVRYHVLGLGLIHADCTEKALRRIVRKLGEDLPLHVLLSLADRKSARGKEFREMEKRTAAIGQALLDTFSKDGEKILRPPNLVSGRDVMEILDIPPGPVVGDVLERVRGLQIDQVIRTREEALSYLEKLDAV